MSWLALADHAHADDFPEQEALRRITAPTLLVHGDRDQFFPVEVPLAMYRLLPDAELCVLPQATHLTFLGRCPEWFNTIVLDFLARRAA
jgi:pimeloyl-ACP methyl ester carboxylesterase